MASDAHCQIPDIYIDDQCQFPDDQCQIPEQQASKCRLEEDIDEQASTPFKHFEVPRHESFACHIHMSLLPQRHATPLLLEQLAIALRSSLQVWTHTIVFSQ